MHFNGHNIVNLRGTNIFGLKIHWHKKDLKKYFKIGLSNMCVRNCYQYMITIVSICKLLHVHAQALAFAWPHDNHYVATH